MSPGPLDRVKAQTSTVVSAATINRYSQLKLVDTTETGQASISSFADSPAFIFTTQRHFYQSVDSSI